MQSFPADFYVEPRGFQCFKAAGVNSVFCFSLSGLHLGFSFCGSLHPTISSLLLQTVNRDCVWEGVALSRGTSRGTWDKGGIYMEHVSARIPRVGCL